MSGHRVSSCELPRKTFHPHFVGVDNIRTDKCNITVRMVENQSMRLTTDSGTLDEGSGKNTHTNNNTTCDLLLLLIRIPTPETTRAEPRD